MAASIVVSRKRCQKYLMAYRKLKANKSLMVGEGDGLGKERGGGQLEQAERAVKVSLRQFRDEALAKQRLAEVRLAL